MYYLYVKQHKNTGLKYFGVTQKSDPFKYAGSGKRWIRHLSKHGKNITTVDLWGFDDIEMCKAFAEQFSTQNSIVKSNEWANLIDENGTDGNPIGFSIAESTREKHKLRTGDKNGFFGKKHSQQTKDHLSSIRKGVGRPHSEETKRKIGDSNRGKLLGKKLSNQTKEKMRVSSPKAASKCIVIAGTSYPSIKEASKATGISRYMLLKNYGKQEN